MSGNNQPEDLAELQSRGFWALEHPAQVEPREAVDRLHQMLRLGSILPSTNIAHGLYLSPGGNRLRMRHAY